ncbi:efflux transporter outer membrane subunit [Pseudomonas tohonis]|uniref:efflux transporter outer membrane subunit n=1 Tax=Pseudomonas tohonis TaxID=2725477 RepID=UPI0022F0E8A1|nr:efflux transporter outer membrane subunit [Pseudomonas tohonis]
MTALAPRTLLPLCLALGACTGADTTPTAAITPPPHWQSPAHEGAAQVSADWWHAFGSPELSRLIQQARQGSFDLAAGRARIRQASAAAVIAGAPLLPEVKAELSGSYQQLLGDEGFSALDAERDRPRFDTYAAGLSASYELDFWGGRRAARDSALHSLEASRFDQATLELTLLAGVASSYLQVLALGDQVRIAEGNLDNARQVLQLVEARQAAGAATRLELAQQRSLVASRERALERLRQQGGEARVALATLLGQPVQALHLKGGKLAGMQWPGVGAGVPSELLGRRPDIAAAEARLAAADADVRVARAAMLPSLTLSASLGTGSEQFSDILRNPYYGVAAGLAAPIFNAGRLDAGHRQRQAREEELLATYRAAIVAAFGDVERALLAIDGLDRQRQWQAEELAQAQRAFELAENRYRAGAETLLTVLETQRSLYQAEDDAVQLHLARLQAAVGLYKALGGGWTPDTRLQADRSPG